MAEEGEKRKQKPLTFAGTQIVHEHIIVHFGITF